MSMHQLIWSASAIGSITAGLLAKSIGLSITIGSSGLFIVILGFILGNLWNHFFKQGTVFAGSDFEGSEIIHAFAFAIDFISRSMIIIYR